MFLDSPNKKRKTVNFDASDANDENFKKPKLSASVGSALSKLDKDKICEQKMDLPISCAREWYVIMASVYFKKLSLAFVGFYRNGKILGISGLWSA